MIKQFKAAIKPFLPGWFIKLYSKCWRYNKHWEYTKRPIKEAFTRIYQKKEWGSGPGEFFSGPGSVDPSVPAYAEKIKKFIRGKRITTVVDLGCGDFRVGSQIQLPDVKYIGIDVVQPLIQYNQVKYGSDDISFRCLDIIKDELPDAELCLLRQVLQHLSNEEIIQVLQNVHKYEYLVVTEVQPKPSIRIVPNKTKPHDYSTRLSNGSGIYLDCLPFNVKIAEVLLDTELKDYECNRGERLVTFLIHNN